MSQGSVATLIGWGGWSSQFIPSHVPFISKSISENCIKIRWFLKKLPTKISWLHFLWPTVYIFSAAFFNASNLSRHSVETQRTGLWLSVEFITLVCISTKMNKTKRYHTHADDASQQKSVKSHTDHFTDWRQNLHRHKSWISTTVQDPASFFSIDLVTLCILFIQLFHFLFILPDSL